MSRCMICKALAWFSLLSLPIAGVAGTTVTVPAGATLEVRLEQPISSYSTHKGTKIECVLIAPVTEGGKVVLPLGTTVYGTVLDIRKVGLGFVHETARVDFKLDRVVLADGTSVAIASQMKQVENARESVDKKGDIEGIRSTSTLGHRATGMMGSLSFGDPVAAIFTTAASSSVLRFSEPEITFPAGTEMIAVLSAPVEVPLEEIERVPPVATTQQQQAELAGMIRKLPFRTYTDVTNKPSDLTNLIFIGSAGAVERAFAASGWEPVDELTAQSTYATVRSIAENQGYKRAPMSTLLLDGKKPLYAYAKTLNTFSKRHHLRIFATTETWDGQPVWTSSSTHDIGIGFSKKNKTFIHLIDTNIDNERSKVVNDFMVTGCVTGVQLVKRPWVPLDAKNGTGEDLITDGKIAVLRLNDCESPVKDSADDQPVPLKKHGNALDRSTRQTVLTLRNNLLRDNVGVMAYSGTKYLAEWKKEHDHPTPVRKVEVGGQEYTVEHGFHPNEGYTMKQPPPAPKRMKRKASWTPPSVEIGIHSGWAGYAGGNGGAMAFLITPPPGHTGHIIVALGNTLEPGWSIGASVTLDSQKYFSHEFSYQLALTQFKMGFTLVDNDSTTPSQDSLFAFDESGLRTSQFAYDLLINGKPKTSRWRPYLAVGPALQLMHLSDAPIKKAPGYFRLGLGNIGLISAAYNFGGTPPLEGGGIFQWGFNYGAGIRYRVKPRWMVQFDYRETLIGQPDFWSKSKKDILANVSVDDGYTLQVIGPVLDGAMRQQHVTAGLNFTF